jgi:hypothetical protein
MVRALLAGTKTQTRRICKWTANPNSPALGYIIPLNESGWFGDEEGDVEFSSGYAVGDRLWVKETWRTIKSYDHLPPRDLPDNAPVLYGATIFDDLRPDDCDHFGKVRQSIFMQARFSRITLTVTDVRVERLQDISEADALAEGIVPCNEGFALTVNGELWAPTAKQSYLALWDSINGEWAHEDNPWVVAVSFDVVHRNIDQ